MNIFAQRVVCNGLWLLAPVMIWNAVFTSKLPHSFSMDVFWKNIPGYVAIPENVLRIALFALPCVTVVGGYFSHRPGYFVFGLGMVAYFASWLALIYRPQSSWSRSAVGFLAPGYTPLVWLSGIALMTESYVGHERLVRWALFSLTVAFLAFHLLHAGLIYRRE